MSILNIDFFLNKNSKRLWEITDTLLRPKMSDIELYLLHNYDTFLSEHYSRSYSQYLTPAPLLTFPTLTNKGGRDLHKEDIPVASIIHQFFWSLASVSNDFLWPMFVFIELEVTVFWLPVCSNESSCCVVCGFMQLIKFFRHVLWW